MGAYRQERKREKRSKKPLDAAHLDEMALAYVARFSTSAAKLERYLHRKVRERGWDSGEGGGGTGSDMSGRYGETGPDIAAIVSSYVERGYVDDAVYARAKASDLLRRGYGGRRVKQALGQAGIGGSVAESVAPAEYAARQAAFHMARKRRFGPFATQAVDPAKHEKQIAAMLRAGHIFDHVRAVLGMESQDAAQEWVEEAAEEGNPDVDF